MFDPLQGARGVPLRCTQSLWMMRKIHKAQRQPMSNHRQLHSLGLAKKSAKRRKLCREDNFSSYLAERHRWGSEYRAPQFAGDDRRWHRCCGCRNRDEHCRCAGARRKRHLDKVFPKSDKVDHQKVSFKNPLRHHPLRRPLSAEEPQWPDAGGDRRWWTIRRGERAVIRPLCADHGGTGFVTLAFDGSFTG